MSYKRCMGLQDVPQFQQIKSRKKLMKQSTNINRDEINTMNIINENTFYLHISFLNNDIRYMKVTLNSKLIGVAK